MIQSSTNTTILDLIELLVVRSYPIYLSILKNPPNKNLNIIEDKITIDFYLHSSLLKVNYQNKKYILNICIDVNKLPTFYVIFGSQTQTQYNLDIREIINITEEDKTMFYLQDESNLLKDKIEFSKDNLNFMFNNIKI